MNNQYTEELRTVIMTSKYLEDFLKIFETTIKNVFYDHFSFLNSLAFYIFHDVEGTETLEYKLKKYIKKIKDFCEKHSKIMTFKKFSLLPSQNSETLLKDKFEFVLNYEENAAFIDKNEMKKLFEAVIKFGKSVTVRRSFTIEHNQDFEKLKSDVKELNDKINKDLIDPKELKSTLNKLMESSENYRIIDYYEELKVDMNTINCKHKKYSKEYLHKCVLKQQKNFVYEETACDKKDCAVCLDDFDIGKSVTKLKCGHLFCTECIEKWFSGSITCPCCRQRLEF